MIAQIGHNSGQRITPGHSWRTYAWSKARRDLLPVLPIEVVRLRVKRAAELGLPYKTYAGIRASNGHDLIGFMFSNNALHVLRNGQGLPAGRHARLASLINTARHGVAHQPVTPAYLGSLPAVDNAYRAPRFTDSWSDVQRRFKAVAYDLRQPADRFVLVGVNDFEREWVAAATFAGYLDADVFFAPA